MDGVEIAALTTLVGVLVWYVKYTTKQTAKRESDAYIERTKREEKHDKIQKEDRDFNRGLITGALKDIHDTGLKSAEMNRKSYRLQKDYQKESVGTLKTICERLNGGTEGIKAIAKLKEINSKNRRKKDKIVKVERRL